MNRNGCPTTVGICTQCQLRGFDISRGTLSQIEAQVRCVTDDELLALAKVLKTSVDSLFPRKAKTSTSKG